MRTSYLDPIAKKCLNSCSSGYIENEENNSCEKCDEFL